VIQHGDVGFMAGDVRLQHCFSGAGCGGDCFRDKVGPGGNAGFPVEPERAPSNPQAWADRAPALPAPPPSLHHEAYFSQNAEIAIAGLFSVVI
jgi:hypothetical protein